jgi:predicted DNA-binding transcriptional regulator YafY
VDERTVRRYVDQLRDLDVPVRSVRGRHGGYRLAPGFRLPPLMLTESEALAVLLGLVAGQRAGLVTTADPAAESAAAKLRRVLPEALGRRLAALLETIEFTAPARRTVTTTETDVLLLMAEAARERRPVSISYTASDGRHSARTVYPYGIVAHSGRWYVTGDDSVSGEVRTFRLDRISLPRVLPGSFDVPAGFDPADQVLAGIAGAPRRHEVSLRVRATAADARARLPDGRRDRQLARRRRTVGTAERRVGRSPNPGRAAGLAPTADRRPRPPVRHRPTRRAARPDAFLRSTARRPGQRDHV